MKSVVPSRGTKKGSEQRKVEDVDVVPWYQKISDFFENRYIEFTDCCYDCCNNTHMWKLDPKIPGHGRDTLQTLQMLQISSTERDLLYTIFKELDFYDRNEVYLRAFLKKFKLRPSPFTTKLFELFDTDKSGAVDFKEFVVTVWNLCTFSKDGLKNCVFRLFDDDDSGLLDADEIVHMLKSIWGDGWSESRVARRIAMRLESYKGSMNVQQFRAFVAKYTALITPIERIREVLQTNILGKQYWDKAAKRRGGIIQQMSREANASAHELCIGGTQNFCVAGGDECFTHKHPVTGNSKRSGHTRKKKKGRGRSRRPSFSATMQAEKSNMKLLRAVLWAEGVELPVTKVFQWGLSSSSVQPLVKRQRVVSLRHGRNGGTTSVTDHAVNGASKDSGLLGDAVTRQKKRIMKENLLLEQRTANARVQRVRHHYTQVSKSLKYARDIQKVRSNQAETFYQERKTNRGLSKREIERRKKALVKKKEQKEEREKKYALRRKKPKKPKSATKKQKDSSARAARPLSAAPRRR